MSAAAQSVVLGRYRVVRPLARGGMGVVYLGRLEGAAGFARPVAIKRISPDKEHDSNASKLFVREARILAQLSHPGIVNVLDFGEEDDDYVMVLEYVSGYHLGAWRKYVADCGRTLRPELCAYIVWRVLEALEYAHSFRQPDGTPTPIIHRDISPGNILLDTHGHVKLLDFGIARIEGMSEYRTRDGIFRGKLPFTAPELLSSQDPSVRSDVYACGVVLYLILTGTNPFRGADAQSTIVRVLKEEPVPIRSLNPEVSEGLEAAVMRALSKNPADRYETAAEFAAALRQSVPQTAEELQVELATVLRQDFSGEMPDKVGLVGLDELDSAWRSATSMGGSSGEVPVASENTETVMSPPPGSSQAPRAGAGFDRRSARPAERSRWGYLLGGLLGAGAAAGAAVWFTRPSKEAQVIVIQSESTRGSGTAGPTPAASEAASEVPGLATAADKEGAGARSAAQAPPATDGLPKATETAAGQHVPADGAGALTRSFRAQQGQIERCFTQHAADVEGQPQISIRFKVAESGQVSSATLSPAPLARTALGGCLLGIAKGTRFGKQAAPIAFSIPITARRVRQ